MAISTDLTKILCCPECYSSLLDSGRELICKKCGNEVPVVDDIPRFWETTTGPTISFDENTVRNPARWTGWRKRNVDFFLKNLRRVNESSMILDVGAGTTPFIVLLKPFRSFKVDVLPYEGIDFLTDLNRALPIPEKVFDCIIMSNLLEHIPEPLRLLKECNRILKKAVD